MVSFVRATPADLPAVAAMLAEAAQWLAAQGIVQWTHYLGGQVPADLPEAIDQGEVYLALRDGLPVGTISLQLEPSDWDRGIWGLAAEDGRAAYVHRLAVRRASAGAGVGDAMLDWAEAGAQAAGKTYLRLDCVGHNDRLNAYYRRRMTFVGTAEQIGMRFHKYETKLS